MQIWVLVGTRPEVIKQIPVYWALRREFGVESVRLVGTGQHRELLDQALAHFGETLAFNLNVMKLDATLTQTAAAILTALDREIIAKRPDWIVVQGDTTSAVMAAIAGFHHRVRIAHNEAGLRSHDLENPFPEEANRKWISAVAQLHFAPTDLSRQTLLKEGVPDNKISVTGNSGIDSLYWTLREKSSLAAQGILAAARATGRRPVLLTAHRRENAAGNVASWFQALAQFFDAHRELQLVYPIHPNNMARASAEQFLAPLPNASLLEPLDYAATCHLLRECAFVVTDSGGIQEESASLGIPSVVCRLTTERPEGIQAGISRLADPARIADVVSQMQWALALEETHRAKARETQPFGDGRAAEKITRALRAVIR